MIKSSLIAHQFGRLSKKCAIPSVFPFKCCLNLGFTHGFSRSLANNCAIPYAFSFKYFLIIVFLSKPNDKKLINVNKFSLVTDDSWRSSANICAITCVFPFKCCLKFGFCQSVNDKECMLVCIVCQFIAAHLVNCEQHFFNCR